MALKPTPNFSPAYLASKDWHECLANQVTLSNRTAAFLALTDLLVGKLRVDSMLLLRFPAEEGPQLLYGDYSHSKRTNSIEEYFSGNYAIDPFYLNRNLCRESGVITLSEVIEESFTSSEYYNVHYRPSGLVDEICFCCTDGQNGHIVLSFSRALNKEHFNRQEIEAVQNISPLVRGYMRTRWHSLIQRGINEENNQEASRNLHQHIENARLNFGRSILTHREFDVLQLLLRGNSVDLIHKKLGISIGTIKVHRKNIYAKLNIRSQAEVFSFFLDVVSNTNYIPNKDPLEQYKEYT